MNKKDRVRNFGEVFTPPHIVKEMIESIPDEVWADPEKTVLEPTCGEGVFVLAVIRKKISLGIDVEQAILKTHGLDIMADNIEKCRDDVVSLATSEISKMRKDGKLAKEQAEKKLARIMSIVDHNIRMTQDTLTEDFDDFQEWDPANENISAYIESIKNSGTIK